MSRNAIRCSRPHRLATNLSGHDFRLCQKTKQPPKTLSTTNSTGRRVEPSHRRRPTAMPGRPPNGGKNGRGGGNRTRNLWFWRPALCQLSYAPKDHIRLLKNLPDGQQSEPVRFALPKARHTLFPLFEKACLPQGHTTRPASPLTLADKAASQQTAIFTNNQLQAVSARAAGPTTEPGDSQPLTGLVRPT